MFDQTGVARAAAELIEKVYCHADSDNVRGSGEEYVRSMIKRLEAVLPAPPRPTLADMTLSERSSCQWMQADVKARGRCIILIVSESSEGCAAVLNQSGVVTYESHSRVTPRPDLPRFEWPDTDQEDEDMTPAQVGDVIESAADLRLAALPVGSILLDLQGDAVTKQSEGWAGLGYKPVESQGEMLGPWKVVYIEQEDDPKVEDVAKVGDVLKSADDPRLAALPIGSTLLDRDGDTVTKKGREEWTGFGYHPIESSDNTFGPWKVVYIPKEDDQ